MDEASYAAVPETLSMREVRAGGWTLVSTLTDARKVSKRDLLDLYRSRWQVELDLRSIKTVMATAAYLGAVLPRQLSFKAALQLLRAFEQNLRHCPHGRLAIRHAHLLGAIAQMKLPHRPRRVEPRAIKRRPKPHKLLTEPRGIVRERLLIQQQRHVAAFLR